MKTLLNILGVLLLFNVFNINAQTKYSFFIAGHTYGQPGVNNIGFHPPFKEKFEYIKNRSEIKFGVLTGDIAGTHPDSNDWDEVDADISELGLPVYMAVGNHDMRERELYESRYGNTYFSFIFENDLFLILDPNLNGWSIKGDQLDFMYNTVNENASSVDNIFVFFHQLLWWENDGIYGHVDPNSNEGIERPINFYTELEPFFHNLNNEVVMCAGDLGAASWSGDFLYDNYDNISFVASGMGEGIGDNFIVINVDEEKEITYDLICLNDPITECMGELTDYEISAIDNLNPNETTLIYPMPADKYIKFKHIVGTVTVSLYNLNGVEVFQKTCKADETIDISSVKPGFYACKISGNDDYYLTKLIILEYGN